MVMPKKERLLKELYNATQIIPLPQITPVLGGSFRMQGPVDDVDDHKKTDRVLSQVDKEDRRPSKNQKLHLRAVSGTCNICAGPSSFCLCVKQHPMDKADAFSDERYSEDNVSYSVTDAMTIIKRRTSEKEQNTTSETSNLVSASSSYNSFSENAESKVNLRTSASDVFGTSKAVEVSPSVSCGGDFKVDDHTLKPNYHTIKTSHTIKFEDPRGLEGNDDSISCVTGADEPNMSSSTVIQKRVPCSASLDSLHTEDCREVVHLRNHSESMDLKIDFEGKQCRNNEHPTLGDADNNIQLQNIDCTFSDGPCGKFPCNDSTSKDLVGESYSHVQSQFPGCDGRHLGFVAKKELGIAEKSSSNDSDGFQNTKVSFSEGNQNQKIEVAANNYFGNHPEESIKPPEQSVGTEKGDNFLTKSDVKEASLQSHHVDDSEESDFMEHDVKVCDICGDAGREDLLALCCRCIDGAEHTYCMHEMLDKVPEGNWLCEECKLDGENKNVNQKKYGVEAGAEKDQYSEKADIEPATLSMKPDVKVSDVEASTTSKDRSVAKVSGKRHAEELEVSSAGKKQAFEAFTGSPRTSSPSRPRALSFDSSIKDIDGGKAKPTHQFTSGSHSGNDAQETAYSPAGPWLQSSRGAFFKSNSFNFSNSRLKTKLVDEVFLQRQKSIKEPASRDTKEGAVKGIGKSLSFRSTNPGRFGASESKVKMLSPNFSHAQDLKGLKTKSERYFERKNSLKSSRVVGNLTTSCATVSPPKVEKKLASHGESVPVSSASNHEMKSLKADGKLIAGSKPTNRGTIIGDEDPVSIGEVKRQLPSSPHGFGNAASNGSISSVEQKPVHSALKDDNSSNPKESTSLADVMKEGSNSFPTPSTVPSASVVPCLICKRIDHSSQFCTLSSPGLSGVDISAVRSPKEQINKDNHLKSAIEAALLKKPGMYRKNRIPDQSDSSSVSSMNNEVASQDRVPSSSGVGNVTSAHEVIDWQGKAPRHSGADYRKQTNGNNYKQSAVLPAEDMFSGIEDGSLMVSSDGNHPSSGLSSHDAGALSMLLKIPAIPDHEYIWQGSFEIWTTEKTSQIWDGLQAHLSTCASPRVFEAVNKLPHKILLNKVSRINAWPVQFESNGVKEDNVALYFFAKDLESYERSYKILLEYMMRGDLALVGSIDGVDLLIFPSNQLPEESHRWNMLFYLWGVFRGKKKNSFQQVPDSPEKFCSPRGVPSISASKLSSPVDICLPQFLDDKILTSARASLVVPEAHAVEDVQRVSLLQTSNGDCDIKVSFHSQEVSCSELNIEQQDCKTHSNSSTRQLSLGRSFTEVKCIHTAMEGQVDSECNGDLKSQDSLLKKMIISTSRPFDMFSRFPASSREMDSSVTVPTKGLSRDVVSCSKNLEAGQGPFVMEIPEEPNCLQCETRKRPYVDLPSDVFTSMSQINMWNDVNNPILGERRVNKKQRSGPPGGNNYHTDSSEHLFNLSCVLKEKHYEEPLEETAIINPRDNNSERYFFPVDPTCQLMGESFIPLVGTSLSGSEQDGLNYKERTPNLELALGAELNLPLRQDMPPCLVGKVDNRIVNKEDQPPEKLVATEEDDDASASLSLSLSFSYADKDEDGAIQAVARTGQLMPRNRQSTPCMFSFGDIPDK